MLPLIDCHLHLQDDAFAADRDQVIRRAIDAGVHRFVVNGSTPDDWPAVAQLARSSPQVIPCFGLHPWYINETRESWTRKLEATLDSVPSAIGECGIDRWIEPRDEPAQERVFRLQLAIARRRRVPVMIHCLRAWGWLMDILTSEPPLPAGMLIHAYGGPAELIAPLADMGAYFSFAGNALEPKRAKTNAVVAAVPLDRLLVETDSPDMPPPDEFGPNTKTFANGKRRNEPANLPHILRGLAAIRAQTEDAIAQAVWDNASRLFPAIIWQIPWMTGSPESSA